MDSLLSTLNEKFANDGVKFALWRNLPAAIVSNKHCEAVLTLHGAHVCEFKAKKSAHPLLWLSGSSWFEPGKPIRGGIPVCWPWFGPAQQPAHGFARLASWSVEGVKREADGSDTVSLSLESNEESLKAWPHKFKCVFELNAGSRLAASLKVFNCGDEPFSFTGALHTYIAVSKITDVKVHGLDGVGYVDSVAKTSHIQQGPVEFGFELDRLYCPTKADCLVADPNWGRKVKVERFGSSSAVVWNPWIEKSKRLPDFGDEEYWGMVCVEAAKAGADAAVVAPGAYASFGTTVSEQ